MAKREEFDREYDMEKETGFDPDEILDDQAESNETEFDFLADFTEAGEQGADDDIDSILSDDFLASLGIERAFEDESEDHFEEAAPMEEILPEAEEVFAEEAPEPVAEPEAEAPVEYIPAPVPAFDVEPELGEEFEKAFEEDFPSVDSSDETDQAAVPVVEMDAQEPEKPQETPAPRRRKKLSKERLIKEVYLPPAILLLTLILLITFVGSAIGRAVKAGKEKEDALKESEQSASSALENEANTLVAEAEALAAGYDYDGAIAKLDSFSGEKIQYQQLLDAYNAINDAKTQVKPIDNPSSIPNLSFHCLIADPARAFSDKEFGTAYNTNYVTIDEFSKILEQLYANGYVLVDFDSFIVETVGEDGKTTYSTQAIYLPDGKKPIMLTETLVNYETFSIDSDGDGEADKGGDGFASKLVVKDGKIVNEYVDADGNVLYGAYDLVPILEEFIEEHPDFSYRGARAILAVSGEDGVFGYRIMHSVKTSKGEDYYNEQVEGATAIAAALREAGYTIACYTYANVGYGSISATKIQVDLDNWKKEVKPVLGDVPVLIYAKASDIAADGNFEGGNKYNVLKDAGFRYFINSANVPYAEVTVNYVRQSRIMVTGQQMNTYPQVFSDYFKVSDILNDLRGS